VWARTGTRPTALRQTEYQWLYVWAAVDPFGGQCHLMITPTVNTDLMNRFLADLGQTLAPDEHAVMILDNAGWHVANALNVPQNITLLHLPPYSPELNASERLWHHLRSHHLANRVYADYSDIFRQVNLACDSITPERIQTLCAVSWLPHPS
jgi:transposase